ncbi:MAG: hypothetical protein HZA34_02305 [Candidatus Pacebacteria bacterium]|nr:hypothetical protein [Candidatus Paceibacterota bacterium]
MGTGNILPGGTHINLINGEGPMTYAFFQSLTEQIQTQATAEGITRQAAYEKFKAENSVVAAAYEVFIRSNQQEKK